MKKFTTTILMALVAVGAYAEDFFSTEKCENLMDLNVNIGINTSNRTIGKNALPGFHREGWGTGFELGLTADINIRNYISIQPGFFYESRSGNYTMVRNYDLIGAVNEHPVFVQAANLRTYHFTIPVMACLHFNITDDIRWNVEMGPYLALRLGSKLNNDVLTFSSESLPADQYGNFIFDQKSKGLDVGLKFGTGVTLLKKYSFAVHYLAGGTHAWNDTKIGNYKYTYGGHSKEWTFTVGYTL